MLTVYYFIPAGILYYLFFIRQREKWKHMRIQTKWPGASTIRHEIKWSVIALSIFAFYTTGLYQLIINEYTSMYFDIEEYGWIYFIVSPVIAFFVHDAYYYWTHRFMHWRPVFRYFHSVHHKSKNPTPFAAYSFQPLETVIQFGIYPLLLIFIPFHPLAVGIFMGYNLIINSAGHTGFEFLPPKYAHHWFFKWQNAVTHHDMHHSHVNCNFGLYFNIWDRLMGTLHKDYTQKFDSIKNKVSKY